MLARHPGTVFAVLVMAAAVLGPSPAGAEEAPAAAAPEQAPPSLDRLVRELVDTDPAVRLTAARALGELRNPAAVGPLIDTARSDPQPEVRGWALRALLDIGTPEAIETIRASATNDPDARVREIAVQYLPPGVTPGPVTAAPPQPAPPPPVVPASAPPASPAAQPAAPQPAAAPAATAPIAPPEEEPPFLQRVPSRRVRTFGWTTFAVSYGLFLTLGLAMGSEWTYGWVMAVPFVGPGVALTWWGADEAAARYSDNETSSLVVGMIFGWLASGLQIVGFSTGLLGTLRARRANERGEPVGAVPRIAVVPSGNGLALFGAF
jgi:hypothetical protein